MLIISNLSKRFPTEENELFKEVSLIINAGERAGVIGPNGSGKSTLIKIIMGIETPTTGSVAFAPSHLRIGYLAQGVSADGSLTVEQVIFPQKEAITRLETQLEAIAVRMAAGDEAAYSAYDTTLDQLITLADSLDEQAGHRALDELELGNIEMDTPVLTLSGGQKTRLILARLIASRPQLLTLDEPTNHLDIAALVWLENWLMGFDGGVLIVSHDRAFLDRVATQIIALDTETPTVEVFHGNYSAYANFKQRQREKLATQWRDQQDEIARMKADVSHTMAKAVNRENATVNDFQRGRAKMVAKKAKAKERRLQRFLESDEIVEKPALRWEVKLEFDPVNPVHGDAIRLEALAVGYGKPLIEDINLTVSGQERIIITGPNGHGKSTLIKTIIGQLAPLRGTVHISQSANIGYLSQEQDTLPPTMNATTYLQSVTTMTSTEARSFLHYYLFSGDDALRPIDALSYGERTRLMLARLIAQKVNVLVMDEPLNHLDLASQEKFEEAISHYTGAMIAVVHDRYFIERIGQKTWHIAAGTIQERL